MTAIPTLRMNVNFPAAYLSRILFHTRTKIPTTTTVQELAELKLHYFFTIFHYFIASENKNASGILHWRLKFLYSTLSHWHQMAWKKVLSSWKTAFQTARMPGVQIFFDFSASFTAESQASIHLDLQWNRFPSLHFRSKYIPSLCASYTLPHNPLPWMPGGIRIHPDYMAVDDL